MIKVIFNRDYHLGKWYKQGDSAELESRLAIRLINLGIIHPAPVPVNKPKNKKATVAKRKHNKSKRQLDIAKDSGGAVKSKKPRNDTDQQQKDITES